LDPITPRGRIAALAPLEARMADDVTQPAQPKDPAPAAGTPTPPPANAAKAAGEALDAAQSAVNNLEKQVTGELVGAGAATMVPGATPSPFALESFGRPAGESPPKGINLLSDVNLNVKIELGRTRMLVEDVLKLSEGAVVELDKLAGDPVDVYVNERHVARGEVLVLNDNFCVRINEIIAGLDGEPSAERTRK
jgi:flagellar motor switch protein FliN/FliY